MLTCRPCRKKNTLEEWQVEGDFYLWMRYDANKTSITIFYWGKAWGENHLLRFLSGNSQKWVFSYSLESRTITVIWVRQLQLGNLMQPAVGVWRFSFTKLWIWGGLYSRMWAPAPIVILKALEPLGGGAWLAEVGPRAGPWSSHLQLGSRLNFLFPRLLGYKAVWCFSCQGWSCSLAYASLPYHVSNSWNHKPE